MWADSTSVLFDGFGSVFQSASRVLEFGGELGEQAFAARELFSAQLGSPVIQEHCVPDYPVMEAEEDGPGGAQMRSYLRSVRLRVADVNKVLTSGHGEGASHIEDLTTINLRQQDGVCRHELIVTQLLGFSSCKPKAGADVPARTVSGRWRRRQLEEEEEVSAGGDAHQG